VPSHTTVVAVKAVHSLVFFVVEWCVGAVLWDGVRGRTDRRTALAAVIVAAESLVFVGNGFRCPLTSIAERHGAVRGGVSDIYLPRWLAAKLPGVHVPLIAWAVWLHRRAWPGGALGTPGHRTNRGSDARSPSETPPVRLTSSTSSGWRAPPTTSGACSRPGPSCRSSS
jgi:hypothetical protein